MLPDKNAAAHRVVANAKILRELGYRVVFLDVDRSVKTDFSTPVQNDSAFGFERWSVPDCITSAQSFKKLLRSKSVIDVIEKYCDVKFVIGYNFPALPLKKINNYCKAHGIFCVSDITEWYGSKGRSFLYKITKGLDTAYRIKVVQKKLDGIFAISRSFVNYYKDYTNIVYLPPLTDISDKKWNRENKAGDDVIRFVYAGSPSAEKENLNVVVQTIGNLTSKYNIHLDVIGISMEQYDDIYNDDVLYEPGAVSFIGKLSHSESLEYVKKADYSFIIRDHNRVTDFGFPTKFSESITCGTAVIATDNSDLKDFIIEGENGYLVTLENFQQELEEILKKKPPRNFNRSIFDYHNYIPEMKRFLDTVIGVENG